MTPQKNGYNDLAANVHSAPTTVLIHQRNVHRACIQVLSVTKRPIRPCLYIPSRRDAYHLLCGLWLDNDALRTWILFFLSFFFLCSDFLQYFLLIHALRCFRFLSSFEYAMLFILTYSESFYLLSLASLDVPMPLKKNMSEYHEIFSN